MPPKKQPVPMAKARPKACSKTVGKPKAKVNTVRKSDTKSYYHANTAVTSSSRSVTSSNKVSSSSLTDNAGSSSSSSTLKTIDVLALIQKTALPYRSFVYRQKVVEFFEVRKTGGVLEGSLYCRMRDVTDTKKKGEEGDLFLDDEGDLSNVKFRKSKSIDPIDNSVTITKKAPKSLLQSGRRIVFYGRNEQSLRRKVERVLDEPEGSLDTYLGDLDLWRNSDSKSMEHYYRKSSNVGKSNVYSTNPAAAVSNGNVGVLTNGSPAANISNGIRESGMLANSEEESVNEDRSLLRRVHGDSVNNGHGYAVSSIANSDMAIAGSEFLDKDMPIVLSSDDNNMVLEISAQDSREKDMDQSLQSSEGKDMDKQSRYNEDHAGTPSAQRPLSPIPKQPGPNLNLFSAASSGGNLGSSVFGSPGNIFKCNSSSENVGNAWPARSSTANAGDGNAWKPPTYTQASSSSSRTSPRGIFGTASDIGKAIAAGTMASISSSGSNMGNNMNPGVHPMGGTNVQQTTSTNNSNSNSNPMGTTRTYSSSCLDRMGIDDALQVLKIGERPSVRNREECQQALDLIKGKWRSQTLIWHPDKDVLNSDEDIDRTHSDRFHRVQEAYRILQAWVERERDKKIEGGPGYMY